MSKRKTAGCNCTLTGEGGKRFSVFCLQAGRVNIAVLKRLLSVFGLNLWRCKNTQLDIRIVKSTLLRIRYSLEAFQIFMAPSILQKRQSC